MEKKKEIENNSEIGIALPEKKDHKEVLKQYIMITLGALIQSAGVYFFIMQNNISMSGVSGFSVLIAYAFRNVAWFPPTAILIVIFNILLVITGFLVLGRNFGFRTVFGAGVFSLFMFIYEEFFPMIETITGDILTELLIGIMMSALGDALLFRNSATSGGTDIIVMIIKKKCHIEVGRALLFTNLVIACSSLFVINIRVGLYSILGLLMESFLVDGVIERFDLCKYFHIVTDKPDLISEYIISNLRRGVTKCAVIGGYSGHPKTLILTVCRKNEAISVKRAIKQIDPDAFIMITNSSEIIGKGFYSGV